MSSVNKAIIVGNLGQDPEMRYTQSGDAVCSLSVATSETWKDKNTGEKKEATEWHRVTIFGKLAEIAGEYLRKGSKVYVEGKIKTQKYTDNNGVEKYSTSIQASEMRMLSSANEGQPQGQQNQQRQQPQQQPRPSQGANPNRGGGNKGNNAFDNTPNFDDDIPF